MNGAFFMFEKVVVHNERMRMHHNPLMLKIVNLFQILLFLKILRSWNENDIMIYKINLNLRENIGDLKNILFFL